MRLITRQELALHKYTEREGRAALGNLAIHADRTQVTNGHLAVTVYTERTEPEDYPSPADGTLSTLADGAPTLLPADLAKAAIKAIPKKAHIPVLGMAAVGLGADGGTQIAATDLESWHRGSAKPLDLKGRIGFPNLDRVTPGSTVVADVGFMVENMKNALDALADLGVRSFRLQIHTNREGAHMMIGRSQEPGLGRVEIVIMPARVDEPPARPGEVPKAVTVAA